MSEPSCDIRIVFLIDVSACRQQGTKWEEAVSLCVFRLLCFFNCELKTQRRILKWGYKLFDIDSQIRRIDSLPTFKDFKLKYFEEFERELRNTLTNTCSLFDSLGKSSKKRSAFSTFPALTLSKCLTETLHDFQWNIPDIGSPLKSKRGLGQYENRENSNCVFLISRVPCDKQSLRYFSNKVVIDKDVFVESIMSQILYQEFSIRQKIRLYWVDTGRYQPPNNEVIGSADKKSYEIVEQSLKSLGGALVPFSSIVTYLSAFDQQRCFAQVTENCSERNHGSVGCGRKGGTDNGRDEVAALFSMFSCMSACSALIPYWSPRKYSTSREQTKQESSLSLIILGHGKECSLTLPLKLITIKEREPSVSRFQNLAAEPMLQLQTFDSHCSACCPLSDFRKTPCLPMPHNHKSAQLEMRAILDQAQARQLGTNMTHHYVCYVTSNASATQRHAFSSLLQTIYIQQQTLVLSIRMDSETSPYLAILEAVSVTSAHLSYLSLGLTLQVEKVIKLKESAELSKKLVSGTSLDAFKNKTVKSIISQTRHVTQPKDQGRNHNSPRMWTGVLNPWHVPGSMPQLQNILNKLTERLDKMTYLSDQEKVLLMEMQQAYRQENQVPFLLQPSRHSTPLVPASTSLVVLSRTGSGEQAHFSKDIANNLDSRSSSRQEGPSLPRGRLMVIKAKHSNSLTQDEAAGDSVTSIMSETLPKPDFSHIDLKSVEDLKHFVQDQYKQMLLTGTGLEGSVQLVVLVTQHFHSSQLASTCPEMSTVKFLRESVLKSCKQLKSNYQNSAVEENGKTRIIEFKLQILLRLEMESLCSSVDGANQSQAADEVVELLQSMLFATAAGEVTEFLNTTILNGYLSTLPQLLVTVYDELMQPLPPALAGFGSPATTASLVLEPLSVSSHYDVEPGSDLSAQLGSNQSSNSQTMRTRSCRLPLPSLTGLSNKRQIVVETKPIHKPKGENTKARRTMSESRSPVKQRRAKEVKRARRNLFNTPTAKTSSKSPDTKKAHSTPKKKSHRTSPAKKRLGNKTMVEETPHHRRPSWRRQQISQQLNVSDPSDVKVIEESPLKQIADLGSSPGQYKPARRVLRQAFYSAGPGQDSRNLARALELSDRIAGRHHRHQHLNTSWGGRLSEALTAKDDVGIGEDMLSPRRQAAAFLRAQLMKSPSPGVLSPAHRKRTRTSPRFSRQRLFEENLSLPAWPSVVSSLDFTSPVKQMATSTLLASATPPRTKRRHVVLVNDTPTKDDEGTGQVTPQKAKRGSRNENTPTKGKHFVKDKSDGQFTPDKASVTKSENIRQILTTQKEEQRGPLGRKRATKDLTEISQTKGNSSSFNSQQSSILDYVSPTGRLGTCQNEEKNKCQHRCLSSPAPSPAKTVSSNVLTSQIPGGSWAADNSDSKQSVISSCDTLPFEFQPGPTCHLKQQFLSPTKSILKNSPGRQRSQSGPIGTPQKSPRVTFDIEHRPGVVRTPSPSGDGRVKTPDSLHKWHRRKRRWSSEAGKTQSIASEAEQLASDSKGSIAESHLFKKSKVNLLHNSGSVYKELLPDDLTDVLSLRKRNSGLSKTDISSPCKRRKTHTLSAVGVSKPTSFSENAMDSYFSSSQSDVFLGSPAEVMEPLLSSNIIYTEDSAIVEKQKMKSPLFKVQPHETMGLMRCRSKFVSEGSQGFDMEQSKYNAKSPPSPVFCTSPTLRHRTKVDTKTQVTDNNSSQQTDLSGGRRSTRSSSISSVKVIQQPNSVSISTKASTTPSTRAELFTPAGSSANDSPAGSSQTTLLRVKGALSNRKYSPNVSTTSLVQLMNSPLLLKSSKRQKRQLFKAAETDR